MMHLLCQEGSALLKHNATCRMTFTRSEHPPAMVLEAVQPLAIPQLLGPLQLRACRPPLLLAVRWCLLAQNRSHALISSGGDDRGSCCGWCVAGDGTPSCGLQWQLLRLTGLPLSRASLH